MFHKLNARRESFYFVFMTSDFLSFHVSLNEFCRVAHWKEKSYS